MQFKSLPNALVFPSLEKWEGIDALMLLSRHMGKGGEVEGDFHINM